MTSRTKIVLLASALAGATVACSSDTSDNDQPLTGPSNTSPTTDGGAPGTGGETTDMGEGGDVSTSGGMPGSGEGGMPAQTGGMPAAVGGGGTGGMGGAPAANGGGGMGGMPTPDPVCGNGQKEAGEACDDGNTTATDGCSATCQVTAGWACNVAGQACTPVCGDGMLVGMQACDDGNTANGDGCSNQCAVEDGFECMTAGMACTPICGDGKIKRGEVCDDTNEDNGDGCSADCRTLETGYICDVPGAACRTAPQCPDGVCVSECGDGLKFQEEGCDDGNLMDGDGCSSTCMIEAGYMCETKSAELPSALAVPVTYRDFISTEAGGSMKHPDHRVYSGGDVTPGMVEDRLGPDGLPVYTGVCEADGPNVANTTLCPFGAQTTSKVAFDQWFRDTADVNLTFQDVIVMGRMGMSTSYVFDAGAAFLPLTGRGWDAQGQEALAANGNFGFTTVMRYWFRYGGDEQLEFSGDDDVWVFIGGGLAVDVGGMHPQQTRNVQLGVAVSNKLGLVVGKTYEMALFHAERAPDGSNFKLTFTGFESDVSECAVDPDYVPPTDPVPDAGMMDDAGAL